MKNLSLMALALCTTTLLSADYNGYGQSSCATGNCPYQGQPRNYNQEASGQEYYRSQANQYDRNNNQNYSRDNQYNRNQPYSRNDGSNQQYQQRNDGQQYDQRNANYRNDGYNHGYDSRNNQYNRNNQDGYYNPNQSNSNYSNTNGYVSDEELKTKISKSLESGWLSSGYPNVNYDVNSGVVYLRGSVKNQDERNDVEKAIRKIDGVREVNNQINISNLENNRSGVEYRDNYNESRSNNNYQDSVKKTEAAYPQDSASSESDRIINSKIRDKLSGWFTKGYETITLNTSNGNVTITGSVEKTDDIEKINKEIKNVDGVKNVNNNANVHKR